MHSTHCDTFKSIIKTKLDLKNKTETVEKSEEEMEKKINQMTMSYKIKTK